MHYDPADSIVVGYNDTAHYMSIGIILNLSQWIDCYNNLGSFGALQDNVLVDFLYRL